MDKNKTKCSSGKTVYKLFLIQKHKWNKNACTRSMKQTNSNKIGKTNSFHRTINIGRQVISKIFSGKIPHTEKPKPCGLYKVCSLIRTVQVGKII